MHIHRQNASNTYHAKVNKDEEQMQQIWPFLIPKVCGEVLEQPNTLKGTCRPPKILAECKKKI
jgi:hypothetical protein